MTRGRSGAMLIMLLAAIDPLSAQTGRVRIRVLDASGHPIANPTASLLGPNHNPQKTVVGNNAGEIVFEDASAGRRDFLVSKTGFKSQILTGTEVADGKQAGGMSVTVCPPGCGPVQLDSSEPIPQVEPLPIAVRQFYIPGLNK